MKEFSVIVLCYNSERKALYRTLASVLNQKNIDMEIILADDASSNHCVQEGIEYLNSKQYSSYKIKKHNKNVGTVQNILDALALAEGEYVKCIGAGDMLYGESTLQQVYAFMQKTGCTMCFGKMQAYHEKESRIEKLPFFVPADIKSHQKGNLRRIQTNIIQHHGWIAGASMFYHTDKFMTYLPTLLGTVRYCEDLLQIILLINDEPIAYMDSGLMYYEIGSGISTNTGSGNSARMQGDHDRFWALLQKQYPANGLIQKGSKMHRLECITPEKKRQLQIILHNPGYVCMMLRTKLQKHRYLL